MINIKINSKTIKANLADTLLKQVRGLMFSKKKNLLFTMSSEARHSFWMLGVSFLIKMVFINSNLEAVDIQEAIPLTLNPKTWKVYRPKEKCRYVLELTEEVKLRVGDKIRIL